MSFLDLFKKMSKVCKSSDGIPEQTKTIKREETKATPNIAPITPMVPKYKILIDNGHGIDTKGKRSPDGRLLEYKYCRDIASIIVKRLREDGYDADLVTPEEYDVRLTERCRRVNEVCKQRGATNVLVISIHLNAKGNGSWEDAQGWQDCVSLNASVRSMTLAECLCDAAASEGLKVRKPKPTQKFWEQNLAICRDTYCPAVLTENLFMDNKTDASFLMSVAGKQKIVNTHIKGIKAYLQNYGD